MSNQNVLGRASINDGAVRQRTWYTLLLRKTKQISVSCFTTIRPFNLTVPLCHAPLTAWDFMSKCHKSTGNTYASSVVQQNGPKICVHVLWSIALYALCIQWRRRFIDPGQQPVPVRYLGKQNHWVK